MRKLTSNENFVREATSLLEDLNLSIANLARYERIVMDGPSEPLVDRINTLKMHRKKLEEMLDQYADLPESEWRIVQTRVQQTFDAALGDQRKISKEFSAN